MRNGTGTRDVVGAGGTDRAAAAVARLILGCSPATEALRREIVAIARAPFRSVLILGETGVGKDLVPRALAECSPYVRGRLEVFNCPAVPPDHLESELFGTTRGAYTGALDRRGAVQRVRGGILSLDEIGAMPLVHQAKILRLLENAEGRRLGSSEPYHVDACFTASTNEDLGAAVREGRFREDLYYRLAQDAVLQVQPLRRRREDVPPLARAFLREAGPSGGGVRLAGRAMDLLCDHDWPGNARELRGVVRAAARGAEREGRREIQLEDVVEAIDRVRLASPSPRVRVSTAGSPACFEEATDRVRRQMLIEALAAAHGNRTRAGVLLGMHERRGEGRAGDGRDAELDLRSRKLAHRKFGYWSRKLL